MQQNLKTDIIYFDTPTDFELEFNLCGCCRMRLLTDKTDDQKLFLHMLARSVSRSRVILVFGKLFGKANLISLVANSIGKKLETVDNSLYGIDSKDELQIIEGSLPLVTDDGYFGGCIIESGPQTIIVLSENKNVRKTIMSTLIHPYIEQISHISPIKEQTAEEVTEEMTETIEATIETESADSEDENLESTEIVVEESEAEITEEITNEEDEDTAEQISEEIEEDENSSTEEQSSSDFGFVFEEGENNTQSEDSQNIDQTSSASEFYLDIDEENAVYSPDKYFSETVYNENTVKDFVLGGDSEENTTISKPRLSLNAVIVGLIIVLVLLIAVVCVCLFFQPFSHSNTYLELLQDIFRTLFNK